MTTPEPSLRELIENDAPLAGVPYDAPYDEPWIESSSGGPWDDGCLPCGLFPWGGLAFSDLELTVGTQGFTGPANRGETGSFGFSEGFNYGTPLACFGDCLSGQFGLQATQSNLSGTSFADSDRTQLFLTGGFFRRVDWGLQGGVVVDYLSEDWYTHYDLTQLRGELSWMFPCSHELGFWFTAGLNSDQENSVVGRVAPTTRTERWEPTDLYAFFYRHRFDECGASEGRFSAGFTGNGDGLIAADFRLPLHDRLALRSSATYLIPTEADGVGLGAGHAEEGWNVFLGITWFPGCNSAYNRNYTRPLFDVANNGTFMIDRLP